MSKLTDLWLSGVFFQALNTPKLVFGRGYWLRLYATVLVDWKEQRVRGSVAEDHENGK